MASGEAPTSGDKVEYMRRLVEITQNRRHCLAAATADHFIKLDANRLPSYSTEPETNVIPNAVCDVSVEVYPYTIDAATAHYGAVHSIYYVQDKETSAQEVLYLVVKSGGKDSDKLAMDLICTRRMSQSLGMTHGP